MYSATLGHSIGLIFAFCSFSETTIFSIFSYNISQLVYRKSIWIIADQFIHRFLIIFNSNCQMSLLSDFFGLAFAIISFNFLITIITGSPTYCLIAIFVEFVIALACAVYLLGKMSSEASRAARYSKCYKGRREKMEENVDHQVKGRDLTWEEKEIMRELETKEKYIFA